MLAFQDDVLLCMSVSSLSFPSINEANHQIIDSPSAFLYPHAEAETAPDGDNTSHLRGDHRLHYVQDSLSPFASARIRPSLY